MEFNKGKLKTESFSRHLKPKRKQSKQYEDSRGAICPMKFNKEKLKTE